MIGEFFHKHDKLPSNDKALKTKTIRQIKTSKNREKILGIKEVKEKGKIFDLKKE